MRIDILGRELKVWQRADIFRARKIRSKLAESIAGILLYAISTSKYPPTVLKTEFFDSMSSEVKDFIEKNWTTFDLFKPLFEVKENEPPQYYGFYLYEVKSKIISEANKNELEKPELIFSFNQKKFFEECLSRNIPVKIFVVYFFDSWVVEVKEFDYSNVQHVFVRNSAWQEERMHRIQSSKITQFFYDLFPAYDLYKIDDDEMEKQDEKDRSEFEPIRWKQMLEKARKLRHTRDRRIDPAPKDVPSPIVKSGIESAEVRFQPAKWEKTKTEFDKPKKKEEEPAGEIDSELLTKLRHARFELARTYNFRSYYIFSNKTLEDLARKKPRTKDEMIRIKGIKETKFEKYGKVMLSVISEHEQVGLRTLKEVKTESTPPKESHDAQSSLQSLRIQYPSAYVKWTNEEDAQLVDEFRRGMTTDQMSKIHNRKHGAILSRLKKIGLILP